MGLELKWAIGLAEMLKYYHSGYSNNNCDNMGKYLKSLLIIFVLAFAAFSSVLGTKVLSEERITKDPTHQYSPAIYGDIVVWHDYRNTNSDIYGYNLKTKQEFQITTNTNYQYHPAIYGDIVVWDDYRNTNADIYGYNLKTGQEFQITTNTAGQYVPAIYCDRVVWYDDRNNNYDIYIAYLDVVCETAKKSLPMDWIMKKFGLGNRE